MIGDENKGRRLSPFIVYVFNFFLSHVHVLLLLLVLRKLVESSQAQLQYKSLSIFPKTGSAMKGSLQAPKTPTTFWLNLTSTDPYI